MPPAATSPRSTLPTPVQMDLHFAEFRPLLTIDEACWWFRETSPDFVLDRIDDGTLRAVDISAVEEDQRLRRELRLYRYSVEHAVFFPKHKLSLVPVDTIFTHSLPALRRDEVSKILNCTPRHVANLPLAGPKLSPSAAPASADRTPRIYRQSLIDFLTQREVQP